METVVRRTVNGNGRRLSQLIRDNGVFTVTLNSAEDILDIHLSENEDAPSLSPKHLEYPGGKGDRVAKAFRDMCHTDVVAITTNGGDIGGLYLRQLEEEGLKVISVRLPSGQETRRNYFDLQRIGGARHIEERKGARPYINRRVRHDLDFVLDQIPSGSYVIFAGSVPARTGPNFVHDRILKLKKRGVYTVVDLSDNAVIQNAFKAGPWTYKGNLVETKNVVDYNSPEPIVMQQRKLLRRRGISMFVTTLEKEGILVVTEREAVYAKTPDVREEFGGEYGCGDTVTSALVSGFREGQDLETSVRTAVAAGAVKATKLGDQYPTYEEVERMLPAVRSSRIVYEPLTRRKGTA